MIMSGISNNTSGSSFTGKPDITTRLYRCENQLASLLEYQRQKDNWSPAGTIVPGHLHSHRFDNVTVLKNYNGTIQSSSDTLVVVKLPVALTSVSKVRVFNGHNFVLDQTIESILGADEYNRLNKIYIERRARLRAADMDYEPDNIWCSFAGINGEGHLYLHLYLIELGLRKLFPGFDTFGDNCISFFIPGASVTRPGTISHVLEVVHDVLCVLGINVNTEGATGWDGAMLEVQCHSLSGDLNGHGCIRKSLLGKNHR